MCAKPGTNLLQAKFYISQYRISRGMHCWKSPFLSLPEKTL